MMENRYLFRGKTMHIMPKNEHLDGKWITGYLSGEHYISNEMGEHLVDPETICQCTGLTDRHGEPIWENDIVEIAGDKHLIEWQDDSAMWVMTQYGSITGNFDEHWGDEAEVIGNKFDNPNFLMLMQV